MKMKSDHHPTFTTTPICDLALSDGGALVRYARYFNRYNKTGQNQLDLACALVHPRRAVASEAS